MFVVEDIVIDILVRLPVKSLLRFKCVCKQWKSIIESPVFVSDHMEYQKVKDRTCFLIHYYDENSDNPRGDHLLASFSGDRTLPTHEYILDRGEYGFSFSGPVNGWFCLYSEFRILLWNPATRESKRIPDPVGYEQGVPSNDLLVESHALLGLDPGTVNEYFKIIQVLYYDFGDIFYRVFSLSTDSWGPFQQFHTHPMGFKMSPGVYVNGFYYWCWYGLTVYAFDTHREAFREIVGPPVAARSFRNGSHVTSYDDSRIGLLVGEKLSELEPPSLDMWVMEVESCTWTKLMTFTAASHPPCGVLFEPCTLFRPGELIFYPTLDNKKLVLWNFVTNETIDLVELEECCWVSSDSTYHESLVSLSGGRGGIDHRHDDKGRYIIPFSDYSEEESDIESMITEGFEN